MRDRNQPGEPQVTTAGPDDKAIARWLEQCTSAFSAGDYQRALTLFSDEALLMPPNSPPVSLDEARSIYQVLFSENTVRLTGHATEVVVSGDLAILHASYQQTVTPKGEGESTATGGPWLIVLKKQPDGSWKGWHNMWTVVTPHSM